MQYYCVAIMQPSNQVQGAFIELGLIWGEMEISANCFAEFIFRSFIVEF